MSFFFAEAAETHGKKTIPLHTARELGCRVCPLKTSGALNPDIPPDGSKEPIFYFLGEAPGCFLPDTVLLTETGAELITTVIKDNNIATNNVVINDLSYEVEGYPITLLKVNKFPTITCTENHEILFTERSKLINTRLPNGLLSPRFESVKNIKQMMDAHPKSQFFVCIPKHKYIEDLIILDLASTKTYGKRTNDNKIPNTLELDEDISFLLGAYLGDGSSNFEGGVVQIVFSQGYKESYVPRIVNALSRFGMTPIIKNLEKRIIITVHSRTLVELFLEWFGNGSKNKRVPKFMFQTTQRNISQFLFGWFVADGSHYRKNKNQAIASISKLAIWDGVKLGLNYGILLGVRIDKSRKENEQDIYTLQFDIRAIQSLQWEIETIGESSPNYGEDYQYYYLKINDIEFGIYTGLVYDKTTTLHQYEIPFIVHNSDEDKQNRPFVGKSGQLLRSCIPPDIEEISRFNNTVRTRTPSNRKPEEIEIECCRNSIISDIETTLPLVIIPVGAIALHWLINESDISKWRGRFFPVKVGKHICWAYPIYHPSFILRNSRTDKNGKPLRNEWDHIFELDLKNLFEQFEHLENPPVYIETGYLNQVAWTEGLKSDRELDKVLNWLDSMSKADLVGFDYETNCLRPFEKDAAIITLALANDKKAVAFPVDYPNAWNEKQLKTLKTELCKFFNSPAKKVCHNVKFEMEWTGSVFGIGFLYTDTWEDTQAQAYVLDERRGMLNLDALIRINFGFWLKNLSNIDRKRMLDFPLEKILPYNALDAKWTLRLFINQNAKLEREPKLKIVYQQLLVTAATLAVTQIRGVCFDHTQHAQLNKQFQDELDSVVNQIKQLPEIEQFKTKFGMTFKPGSPDHILKCFKTILNVDEQLKKDNGKYSTDEPILSALKNDFELAKLILDYRHVAKKISTYIEPYPSYVMPKDGRIHTNYNPYDTTTGRLSASDPNLQNVPNRTGKELRRMICAPENHWMVCSDYGQIEARIIGVASQDEEFCKALWEDYDVHMHWATVIANEYPKVIKGSQNLNDKAAMKKFRAAVKNLWVFPAFYGASPHSIAKGIGVPIEIVLNIFRDFWRTFRGVKQWQKWILSRYEKLGYVETLSGRRRHAPMTANAVLNASIQGFASDICVDAMCRLDRLGIETVLNIHDDVTSYIHDKDLDSSLELIAHEMCRVPFKCINVPISVEISAGPNWFDQEEIGTFKSTDFYKVSRKLQDFTKLYDVEK